MLSYGRFLIISLFVDSLVHAILSSPSLPNCKPIDNESIACMIDDNEMIRVNIIIENNAVMLKTMKQPHDSNGKPRPMKYMLDDRLIQPVSSIIW